MLYPEGMEIRTFVIAPELLIVVTICVVPSRPRFTAM